MREKLERIRGRDAIRGTTKIATEISTSGKNEIEVIAERNGKFSSWKRVEEHRINKPSQQFKKKRTQRIARRH
jgi:hypothetical protein